jgi:hypothetical protein
MTRQRVFAEVVDQLKDRLVAMTDLLGEDVVPGLGFIVGPRSVHERRLVNVPRWRRELRRQTTNTETLPGG